MYLRKMSVVGGLLLSTVQLARRDDGQSSAARLIRRSLYNKQYSLFIASLYSLISVISSFLYHPYRRLQVDFILFLKLLFSVFSFVS